MVAIGPGWNNESELLREIKALRLEIYRLSARLRGLTPGGYKVDDPGDPTGVILLKIGDRKISTIKTVRGYANGMTLKEAKDLIGHVATIGPQVIIPCQDPDDFVADLLVDGNEAIVYEPLSEERIHLVREHLRDLQRGLEEA